MHRLVLGLLVMSCSSNDYTNGALALTWKPPPGVKLEAEATEGPITTARFSGGVEVRSVAAPAPAQTDNLDALREAIIAGAKMNLAGQVLAARTADIGNGASVRWEIRTDAQRSLLYYVPGKGRYVVISMVAPPSAFDRKSDQISMSLASLKLQ